MARWMILYSDPDGEGRCAIVNDTESNKMPFGCDEVLNNLDDYNDGGSTFIVELSEQGEPMVILNDEELGRTFIDI